MEVEDVATVPGEQSRERKDPLVVLQECHLRAGATESIRQKSLIRHAISPVRRE
jgi:hypothetical protein